MGGGGYERYLELHERFAPSVVFPGESLWDFLPLVFSDAEGFEPAFSFSCPGFAEVCCLIGTRSLRLNSESSSRESLASLPLFATVSSSLFVAIWTSIISRWGGFSVGFAIAGEGSSVGCVPEGDTSGAADGSATVFLFFFFFLLSLVRSSVW